MLYRGYRFDGSANLILNGSFEIDTTGWANVGTNPPTTVRSTAQAYIGAASALVTFAGVNSVSAVNLLSQKATLTGRALTFTMWVRTSAANVRLVLQADNASPSTTVYSSYHTGGGGWELLTLTTTTTFDSGGSTTYIYVGVVGGTNDATAYIDGAVLCTDGLTLPTVYGASGSWTIAEGDVVTDYVSLPRGRTWDALRTDRARIARARYDLDCVLVESTEAALLTSHQALMAKRGVVGVLRRVDAAGNTHSLTARLGSVEAKGIPANGRFFQPIRLRWESAEPPWRGLLHRGTVTVTGAEGSLSLPNNGGEDFGGPVFTLTAGSGSVTAFGFTMTSGTRVWKWAWTGTLAATKALVVNCGAFTVTNDGANAYSGFALDATHNENDWASAIAGGLTFTVSVTHSGTDPSLVWTSADAWG